MSSNVFASTLCAIVISCTWVLSAFASELSWSFVLDFKAEGTTQNKSLSLGEWRRAGCTYSPAPAVCYETILIDVRVYFDDKFNRKKMGGSCGFFLIIRNEAIRTINQMHITLKSIVSGGHISSLQNMGMANQWVKV